jgi:hypothetical protein
VNCALVQAMSGAKGHEHPASILPLAMNGEETARGKFSATDRMSVPLCSNRGVADAGYNQRDTGILPVAMDTESDATTEFNATGKMPGKMPVLSKSNEQGWVTIHESMNAALGISRSICALFGWRRTK